MKRILILGASGLLGKALVKKICGSGSRTLVLASRHAEEHFQESKICHIVNCDATDELSLHTAMADCDTVFCAISGDALPTVAKNIIAEMKRSGISRLIFMGAVGIYNEIPVELDDEDNVRNNPEQVPNRDAVKAVEASDLNYTIIRPGYLKDGDDENYVLTFKDEPAKGYESTLGSVVDLAVRLIDDDTLYSRMSVSITKDMTKRLI